MASRVGKDGKPGKDGKDGKDVKPEDLAKINNKLDNLAVIAGTTAAAQKIGFADLKGLGQATKDMAKTAADKAGEASAKITEKFDKLSKRLKLPELLNAITLIVVLHNAAMLSNQLIQTLGSIVSSGLSLIGLKDENGQPHDINSLLGKNVTDFMKSILGETVWDDLVEDWQQANRVYQATTNVFNQVTNLGGILTAGLEVVGGNVGKIGNALKRGGVLLDNAHGYMNPQPNLKGKFFAFLNNTNEKAQTIAMVVAIPLAIKQALSGINSSVADLKREIAQEDPKDEYGHPIRDEKGAIVHYKPGLEVPTPIVVEKESLQSKADSTNFIELVIEDIFDGGD